jgi:hypothetical protein
MSASRGGFTFIFPVSAISTSRRMASRLVAPALTLEGMLMKIHVAGFTLGYTKPGTFSAPYHGMICKDGPNIGSRASSLKGTRLR